jgi:dTMP kinase
VNRVFEQDNYSMKPTSQASGHFIVIEGPDGSGKTTQLIQLREALTAAGFEVVVAREPGGTPQGMKIRQLFLDGQGELDPMAEVLLLLAAKAQLLREVVYPAYNSGKVVLMDRYTDSLYAYQGGGRQLGYRRLNETVRAAALDFTPTMTFFLDTPLDVCLDRITTRSENENNSIDRLDRAYHTRVHGAYQELIARAIESCRPHCVLEGTQSPDAIHQQIVSHLGIRRHEVVTTMRD